MSNVEDHPADRSVPVRRRQPSAVPGWFMAAVAALLLIILVLTMVIVIQNDGAKVQGVFPSVSTAATSSSTASSVPDDAYLSAVWPWADSSNRYNDPVSAATGFARDFLGIAEPLAGMYLEGDGQSGEVEVRPGIDGPVITVFVRKLGPDQTWWVLGCATANVSLERPTALNPLANPFKVVGQAVAFEGIVDVALRQDGSATPIMEGTVTGGGLDLQPFNADLAWNREDADAEAGALLLFTSNPEDGSIWEASVVRVLFPHTDDLDS